MAALNEQDPKFMDFMFHGLDHGVASIAESGGPLVPFLMTQTGDKKELKRFVTAKYEDGISAAKKTLIALNVKPDFALIAFDGFITWEEKKYDAIYVSAFDKTQDEGFEFCQRYLPKKEGIGIEPTGNSAFIGKIENVLLVSSNTKKSQDTEKKKPWWKF
ncbi:hypothetical protein Celal_0680 [Cellulophaga algicola DSM 14237]|uniref:Uncharacterized protein n=1 Tax=Cellulophaga algicola (strain DSM 14237 / IC166 / ACAM 630) TaxID=688270 RepID=E6XDA6_CELAD|nr:hypothetical protein [Cellulophaga algicola]ADV48019.1 hypothetical protein Celal_0680 [Cellulophaga algicola DSM 14237]